MKKQNFGRGYYEKIYDLPSFPSPVPSGYIDWKRVAIYRPIRGNMAEPKTSRWLIWRCRTKSLLRRKYVQHGA